MGIELSAPAKAAAVSTSMVSDEDAGRPSYLCSSAVVLSFSLAAPGFLLSLGLGAMVWLSFPFDAYPPSVSLSLLDFDLLPACPRAFSPGSP